MRKILAAISSAVIALLPGCDAIDRNELKPGVSTGYEVRDRMGPPTMEWKDSDGSVTWEYPRTPNGVENYMVVIGPDNVLREIRQVLTEANFARVQPGMDKAAIRRLLGKPAQEMFFPLKKEWVWDWKVKSESSTESFFNVHFDEGGRVVRTSMSQTSPGG
ncbi:MAG: outer membrane protein assembly factor BamE [Betaproteobacteria bacterium]